MNRTFRMLALTLGLLIFYTSVWATTRYVSLTGAGTYSTVNSAYTAAVSGDTILIGPGYYTESLSDFNKRLTIIGAGWDQTTVNAGGNSWYFSTGATGTVIEGIHWTNGASYAVIRTFNSPDSITLRRCLLERPVTANSPSIIQAGGTTCRLYVDDCIIVSGVSGSLIDLPNASTVWRNCVFAYISNNTNSMLSGTSTSGITEVYNCVFLNARNVFYLPSGAQPVIAINNIFYDWGTTPSFGTYPTIGSTFDYNASTSALAAPGTNAIALGTTDPFVNYDEVANYIYGTSDLHLAAGSPLIDVGHPSLTDFLDATRSDLGIYGGPRPLLDGGIPNYPWAVNIVITPNLVGTGTPVNATATGRVGPQY